MFGGRMGLIEMAMIFFMWSPALVLPALALWLLWRGVRALEAIASALRERK